MSSSSEDSIHKVKTTGWEDTFATYTQKLLISFFKSNLIGKNEQMQDGLSVPRGHTDKRPRASNCRPLNGRSSGASEGSGLFEGVVFILA